MFDNLFIEMGPWASALALVVVVTVPAIIVIGETMTVARGTLAAERALERVTKLAECLTSRWLRR